MSVKFLCPINNILYGTSTCNDMYVHVHVTGYQRDLVFHLKLRYPDAHGTRAKELQEGQRTRKRRREKRKVKGSEDAQISLEIIL